MRNRFERKRTDKNKQKKSQKSVIHSKKYRLPLDYSQVKWDKIDRIFNIDRQRIHASLSSSHREFLTTKTILKLLAGGALFTLSLSFPTLPHAIAPFLIDQKKYQGFLFRQSAGRLQKQKLVNIVYKKGVPFVEITHEGKLRTLRYKIDDMEIKKPKIWDRKWRMVIFDIDEKHKSMRELFRRHLKRMDFFQLQKSVWVHPYPCFDEIEFLRNICHVGVKVIYIVAEKAEGVDFLLPRYDLT